MKVRAKAVFHSWLAVATIASFFVAAGVIGAQVASAAPPLQPDIKVSKSCNARSN